MRVLVWLRADLRCRDNLALVRAAAAADEGVIALFLVAAEQWREHDWADIKVEFLLRNLRELSAALAKLNIPLLIREAPAFNDAPAMIATIARECECGEVVYNREYEVNERRRDEAVEALLGERGVQVRAFDDQVILPPGSVRTQEGNFYSVFTPFKRAWLAELTDRGGVDVAPAPKRQQKLDIAPDPVPDPNPGKFAGFDLRRGRADLWPAGEKQAAERLERFVAERIDRYAEDRDRPDLDGTSALSPYLTLGAISPRQCVAAAVEALGGRLPGPKDSKGPAVWISELIWREFYKHLLVGVPRLSMGEPMKLETRSVPWRDSTEDFAAWQAGRTGIPIVDAGMRQLAQTGWMHNRVRMITAMFLSKNLLLDWRLGERHFMRHLIDGDLAANNGGWQWSASTGADAAPYLRIMNPITQSRRFDPEAVYIKRFVPELAQLDSRAAHDPSQLAPLHRAGLEYPEPICDLKASRARAIEAFSASR